MSTTKELRNAAEELIDVLKLVDVQIVNGEEENVPIVISKKATDEEIIAIIKEAAEEIQPDDDLSDETREIIDGILNAPKKKIEKLVPVVKGKKVPVVVEIEEGVDPGIEEEELNNEIPMELIDEINDAVNIKQLKELIDDYDVFTPHVRKLKEIKDVVDLRDAMLEIVSPVEPEPVVEIKKPVKQSPVPPAKKKAITIVKEEKPVPVKEKKEKVVKVKKEKRITAFGVAIELLCSNPSMDMETLKKKVKSKGIDPDQGNGLRSAHVIVKKIVKLLTINGLLK
jgi:hypothetical protein